MVQSCQAKYYCIISGFPLQAVILAIVRWVVLCVSVRWIFYIMYVCLLSSGNNL